MKKLISLFRTALLFFPIFSSTLLSQVTNPPIGVSSFYGTIKIGEKFTYKIEVKIIADPNVLEFKLLKGPEGMQVDSKLGIVTWTPTAKGEFAAEIGVYSNNTKVGSFLIKLKVVDMLGTISGTVTNDDEKALANVAITINKKVVSTGKPDSYIRIMLLYTDANGKYNFTNVESGTYYIYVEASSKRTTTGETYLPVWYDDAPTFDKAKGVLIDEANPKFEANLKLHLNPNIPVTTYTYAFTIQKNQLFTYQISIPLPANILPTEFRLLKPLSTLTVDKDKGIVTWTPTETGEFSCEIGVYNNNHKIAIVILKFRVTGFLGTVKGNVKDDDGLPLKSVLITLYKKISITQKNETFAMSLSALTDDKGNYLIEKVEAGSYYIYARPAFEKIIPPIPIPSVTYSPVWYKDSPTMDKADPVEISESNKSVEANLTMHKYVKQEPKIYSISGKVTFGVTPIANAIVLASMSAKVTTGSVNPTEGMGLMNIADPALGVFTDIISKAVTDKDGNYKLQVKDGASYIISCYALGYQLQFYNGKSNILDATKLTPDKDLTGIDFNLTPAPQANGKISGKIVDDLKTIVTGKTILYSAAVTPINLFSRTVNTNEFGEFIFEKVPDGKYYLQVIPSKGYMPAYYKSNDCGIREPKLADLITVENEGSITGITVCVKKVTTTGGGKISGSITDMQGIGIGGAIVTAESKDLIECAFGITENNGSYEILNLGVGNYSITGEKFGYTTITREGALIDYTMNSFSSTVDLILDKINNVTSVERTNTTPTEFILEQNYPNPFNPTTKIKFGLPESGFTKLIIYDVLGNEVKTLVNSDLNAGFYEVEFNASNLASGIYFYRMQSKNFSTVKKLVLIK